MVKRLADWLEKISVGSLLIGIFQSSWSGIIVAVASVTLCFYITWLERRLKW